MVQADWRTGWEPGANYSDPDYAQQMFQDPAGQVRESDTGRAVVLSCSSVLAMIRLSCKDCKQFTLVFVLSAVILAYLSDSTN